MNFEKIKNFILEKKQILLLIGAILVIVIFVKKNDISESEKNGFEKTNTMQVQDKQASSNASSSSTNLNSQTSAKNTEEVTCDISGAVRHQGVYTLKNGARLQELIEAAGGLKNNAQVKAINRAVLLKDQDKIHIPYKGEKIEAATTVTDEPNTNPDNNSNHSNSQGGKINLNTASAADLQKLNGIGEKKAEQIIAYREQNGNFKKIEDLMQVSGIGEKTFAALKDQLSV